MGCEMHVDIQHTWYRAGGNGTAGTAMAVPDFEGGKSGVAWILTYACVIECSERFTVGWDV